jgi:hypothetical protein
MYLKRRHCEEDFSPTKQSKISNSAACFKFLDRHVVRKRTPRDDIEKVF